MKWFSFVLVLALAFSVGAQIENESVDVLSNNESVNESVVSLESLVLEGVGESSSVSLRAVDAKGQSVVARVKSDFSAKSARSKNSILDVEFEHPIIHSIAFENVAQDSMFDIGIDVPDLSAGPEHENLTRVFAIDPSKMDFEKATVKLTSMGTDLFKCALWNFESQRCDGSWVKVRDDLVPGREYEIELSPADPGFAEGVRTNMRAYASGGANPIVTAVVTDGEGIGVSGVTVNFTSSAGVMTPSSGVTGSDGTVNSTQSGGALGDLIALSSTNLTNVTITTAASAALAASSPTIIWLDNRSQIVKTAVTSLNGVLVSTVTTPTYTAVAGGTVNNPATVSMGYVTAHSAPNISESLIWHNSYQRGDFIQVNVATTTANPDFFLVLPRRPQYNLFAYATGGVNPNVTVVVMDLNNTGVANATVNFTVSAGSISAGAVTGPDGTVTVSQTGGVLGDQINVTGIVDGFILQPSQIITAASPAVATTSRAIAWRPNQTEMIYVATVSQVLTSLNVLSTAGIVSVTNLDRTPYNNVLLSSGSLVNQDTTSIGSIRIAPGTYGTDDVLQVGIGTTTPTNDQAVILDRHQLTKLETFATGGANPNVTAVVLDVFNRPVSGVNVSFSSSAGIMTPSSGITGSNGTIVSAQSGGALGDTINVTTVYGNQTLVTSASPALAATDASFGWYDPTDRSLHLVTVNLVNRTLVTAAATTAAMTTNDESPDTAGVFSITTVLQQNSSFEALAKVAQGTSVSGDLVTMTKTTTTPTVDAFITLPSDASQFLYAFAQGGANPLVTAVVTDASGNGVSGVNVSFSASAGTMTPSSAVTSSDGVASSQQSGGALGDSIVVSAQNLTPTTIMTAASVAVAAADYVYSWFEGVGNIARSATVTRANNVLVSGTTTSFMAIDNSPTNNLTISLGSTTQQVTTDPAFVTVSNKGAGDVIEVNVLTTNAATDAVLTINSSVMNLSSSETTLEAFATGGSNPTVTAVVKDAFGNGVGGIAVNFTSSVGTMTPASGVTGSDGSISSVQSGGSLGNTITVSTANTSSVAITTANSVAIAATSFGVSWFDAANADLKVAVVSTNRVLNSGTITPTFTLFDVTVLNQVSLSVGLTQSQIAPNISITPVWRRTYGEGDQIFVEIPTSAPSPDAVITLRNNSNNSLFAYALSGANPAVVAVVTDSNGAGVPNVPVSFSSSAGIMTPSSGVTGIDGTLTSVQSGGVVGDIIVVNTSSQNWTIVTAVSPVIAASSRAIVWWDNSTNRVNSATVSQVAASRGVLTTTGVVTPTNVDNTPLNNVTSSSGSIVSQLTNIPGRFRLAQGTYGDGDISSIGITTTTPTQDGAIRLYENQRTFVDAFATGGANPTVTAFVHDLYGAPVSGVAVNFSSTAGVMSPSSATTDHTGIVQSTQSGGALADNISVVALDLSPINITATASAVLIATSPVYAIMDPSSRLVRVASVTESNNVLTTASSTSLTTIQGSFSPRIFTLSTVVAQTSTTPSLIQIIPVSNSPSDMITVSVGTTTAFTDAFLRLPQSANRSLYAFATGGANPTVTAVVIDEDGIGVAGVPVSFTPSAGVMSPSSGSTNSSGMFSSTQSGGALGNTILVSSSGLSSVLITTAASAAIAAADVSFAWFDPDGSNVYSAAVTRANNVLTTAAVTSYDLIDNTPNNNASVRNVSQTAQSSSSPGLFLINRTTAGDGDYVIMNTATTTQAMDGIVFVNLSTTTPPTITINKTSFPNPVPNGSLLNYTITLNNTGGLDAQNVTVVEIYAPNVTFVNASPAANLTNNTWFLGNLSGYSSTSITITVNVSANATQGGTFNNTAVVNWSSSTANFTANVTINTTVGTEPNLVVSKSASPNPVFSGSQLLYQISVQNVGSANATNVTLIDVLPAGVDFLNASPSNFSNSTWFLPDVATGDTLVVNITVNVTALGGSNVVNTANVSYLNSSNGTIFSSASANVSVLTPPLPPTPGGGGGGGGGGAGGGGAGGGGLPPGTFEKTLPEQTVSLISTLDVFRGEEIRFPLIVTNTFSNAVLNDVWVEVEGPLAQYVAWIPDKLNNIPYGKSAQFLVSLFAPNYATAQNYELTFLVHGVLEAEETIVKNGFPVLSKVKKPILIQQKMKLVVRDLSPQKQSDIMREADSLLGKLSDNGLPTSRAQKLYNELVEAVKANNGERVNVLLDALRSLVNLALEAKSDIDDVNVRIRDARVRGLDTREAERVLSLAVSALNEEDFERAIRLAAQAGEISFIELKGAFNLLNFFVRNWWILLVLSAVVAVGGASSYSAWFVRHVKSRLVGLDDEEEILYDEMKKASEQAYVKKSISMSAYHRMLSEFESHLEKIDAERSRLRIQRAKLFSVSEELLSVDHERKSLTEQVRLLQESYYLKESLGANKYRKRENTLQRRLAHLDVDFELLKGGAQK